MNHKWDFNGDGAWDAVTGSLGQTKHSYTAAGVYEVSVTVTDDVGATAVAYVQISVSSPPVVHLSANPTSGSSPLHVEFDASGSTDADGQIVCFQWDFDGDGVCDFSGAEAQLAHEYPTGGAYHTAARAIDNDGLYSAPAEVLIRIDNPPIVRLIVSPTQGLAPLDVYFDASASSDPGGSIVSYEWNIDGDYVSTGSVPHYTCTYLNPGNFGGTVRVTDNDGYSDEVHASVQVGGPLDGSLNANPPSGT